MKTKQNKTKTKPKQNKKHKTKQNITNNEKHQTHWDP